jgi:hypothetical protein
MVVQCRPTQDALLGTPAVKGREESARTIAHPPAFRFTLTRAAYRARRLADAASGWLSLPLLHCLSALNPSTPQRASKRLQDRSTTPITHFPQRSCPLFPSLSSISLVASVSPLPISSCPSPSSRAFSFLSLVPRTHHHPIGEAPFLSWRLPAFDAGRPL